MISSNVHKVKYQNKTFYGFQDVASFSKYYNTYSEFITGLSTFPFRSIFNQKSQIPPKLDQKNEKTELGCIALH